MTGASTGTRFQRLAIVLGAFGAAACVLATVVTIRYGDRTAEFGWTTVRSDHGFVIEGQPSGPASGVLQPGDEIIALNGDRHIARWSPDSARKFLPLGDPYTLSVRRDGRELTLPLVVQVSESPSLYRLSLSLLFDGVVWCLIATVIALVRWDQPVARAAYAAGMAIGLYCFWQAPQPASAWTPHVIQVLLLTIFPIAPVHLAIGYDFYVRFPRDARPPRVFAWLRIALYVACAILAAERVLVLALLAAGHEAYLAGMTALEPLTVWSRWTLAVVQAVVVFAILAVLAHNYRTVERRDDRRRIRWVVWGTVVALVPGLIISILAVIAIFVLTLRPVYDTWLVPANLATVAIPLSFGYAIIKHQVFDITFVLRRGLQYLFAKNALRTLLWLPVAALGYGVVAQRDQAIAHLLANNSAYVYCIVIALISLRSRTRLMRWLDRRFFREAYDRERILVGLLEDVEKRESGPNVSKLVGQELDAAFHPSCLFIWSRNGDAPSLTLSYSSGGYIHCVELRDDAPLAQLAVGVSKVIELPTDHVDSLPAADRDWLADTGVRLLIPMIGSDRMLLGVLMLGDKKSDEPYSSDDVKLLEAVARQIAIVRENVRLKERAERDRPVRHGMLSKVDAGLVNHLKECPLCGACYDETAHVCAVDSAALTLSLPIERTIEGKYRLERLIGTGGMGAAYEAMDLRLMRSVVVKIMLGRAFGGRGALRRFEREAQALARLMHPNVVAVYDFGPVGVEGAFIVMELVRGRTLRRDLQEHGQRPPVLIAAWFEQICAAVTAAHAQRIVHRDLKPENVLISATAIGSDLVKVVDFGLAKLQTSDTDETALTQAGVVVGTVGYMAPEQMTGGDVDGRADVFALGVMIVEAVMGRRPFVGRTANDVLMSITRDPLRLPGDGPQWRALEAALQRAVARDPSDRYETVDDLSHGVLPALRAFPAPTDEATMST